MTAPGTNVDDVHIVQQVLQGNVDAYEQLVLKYQGKVSGIVARRVARNDVGAVAQEVFVSAFRSLGTYRQRQPFEHWLASIAVRRCMDYWRKTKRRNEHVFSDLTREHEDWARDITSAQSAEAFERLTARREAREVLDWALGHLEPEERALIELAYFEERSMREVADLLGIGVSNAKVRALRARRRLRKVIEELERL